jgi:hypothetical protein
MNITVSSTAVMTVVAQNVADPATAGAHPGRPEQPGWRPALMKL